MVFSSMIDNGIELYEDRILGEMEMFKVAICDDNRNQCNEIENIVEVFFLTETFKYEVDIYISGEELIYNLNAGEKYDLIYLDIELEELNGVFVGQYIREELQDDTTQIVYISGKISYVLELFQIRPMHFLIKPLNKQQVIKTLEKTIELQGRQTKVLTYRTGKTEKKVPFKNIIYFSSDAKKVIIHMKNSKDSFYGKLTEVVCPSEDFLCIHKSYIINLNHVVQFKFDSVILTNFEEIPISRAYRKEVREKLMEWYRKGK